MGLKSMTKTVTLEHVGFQVTGEVNVNMWGGGTGWVIMDTVTIFDTRKLDKEHLKELVNDGGFGVESYNHALLTIEELYEDGFAVRKPTRIVWK